MDEKKIDIMPKSMHQIGVELVTRRDTVTVSTGENSERVVMRTFFEPICLRLWEIAKVHMINNHSDLMLDAVTLSHAKKGTRFLWGWRVTGTTLIKLTPDLIKQNYFAAKVAYREPTPFDQPIAVIPLKIKETVIGVLTINKLLVQKTAFTNMDYELFTLLAGHAATAVFSAKLYSTSERKLTTLQGFLDMLKAQPAK